MTINKLEFKKNISFILVVCILIFILIALYAFISNKNSDIIKETELSDTGSEEYSKLVINEYMSSSSTIIDEYGETYDWIELYNGNNKDINLKNYGLSDQDNKIKWVFPDVTISAKSYLVVYLAGQTKEGLYAPFKLKSSGEEQIVLIKPSGKVLDAVNTVALLKGQSAARDLDGNWIITNTPTPNFVNTKEGYQRLYESMKLENNPIKINEILPKNNGNFTINGKFYGYVEIINEGNSEINLGNYYISNDLNRLYKYRLENITLKPNQVVVIYTGINNEDSNHFYSSFDLENKNGTVYLSNNYGIVDSVTYNELPNGFAYMKVDGKFEETTIISPGYLNNNEGVDNFSKEYQYNKNSLLINEIMNNNSLYLAQNGYKFYDWIELYNNSDETINLSDYTLTTTTNNIAMTPLPNVELKPHSYYILMASGDTNLSNKTYTHINFKISDAESIYLYKGKEIIDSVMISNIPINYSYGRGKDYGFYYIATPTPLKENKVGTKDISYAPTFSKDAGIYNNVDKIKIELEAYGNIYYTLDGSTPNSSSLKYNGYIELDKTSVVKAISIENGKLKSAVITKSYIINENHTLPVLSMSLDNSSYNKLLANVASDIEVAGNLEFYEDGNQFSIPCSISLFGGSARYLNKKSYAIKFKSEYGASSLVYNLFDNRDTAVYESIVLRSGSQDYEHAFFRDILGTSLVGEYTDVDTQSYKIAVLYINGKYFGIYNIREKINDDFIANHYNVNPDKLNLVQGKVEVKNGTADFYYNVLKYVKTHDMTIDSNYEDIKKILDVENFIDFWVAELYTTNNDIINIRYFSHPDIDNGKMKMILFDLDYAFYNYRHNYYYFMTDSQGMNEDFRVDNTILINLMRNKNFKKDFLSRLSYNLNNTWKTENVLARFEEIYSELYPEMKRNQERWNLSFDNWISETEKLKTYILKRNEYLLNQTKSYFKLSDEEYNYYFGGVV